LDFWDVPLPQCSAEDFPIMLLVFKRMYVKEAERAAGFAGLRVQCACGASWPGARAVKVLPQ